MVMLHIILVLLQKKSSQVNHSLQSYLQTSDGRLVAHLVREFLAFFELRHTLRDWDYECDCYAFRVRLNHFQGCVNSHTATRFMLLASLASLQRRT